MIFPLILFLPLLLHAFTLPPNFPQLPTNLTLPSLFLPSQLPAFRGHCVNERVFPGWSGTLNSDDCLKAGLEIQELVTPILKRRYTFWAKDVDGRGSGPDGGDGWELPEGAEYGLLT